MRLGTIKGVKLIVNPLFFAVCLVDFILGFYEILLVIGALVFHEVAHALAAWACGWRVERVELFPFGGQIQVEGPVLQKPSNEILVALAGPVASLFLAGLILIMKGNLQLVDLSFFLYFNVFLGVFNLLPALPLDGGRILRTLVAFMAGIRVAWKVSSWLGLVFAFLLLAAGVYLCWKDWRALNLILVACFLGYKAYEEQKLLPYTLTRYLLRKRMMLKENQVVGALLLTAGHRARVDKLLQRSLPGRCLMVLVMDDNRISGVVTEIRLIDALMERGPDIMVGELLKN